MSTKTSTKSVSERALEERHGQNLPATQETKTYAPPAHLAEFADQDTGKGVSTAADDNLVPLIYVLQALSPQVDRRNGAYIEGAKAGDIWLKNAPPGMEIIDGEAGIVVQPCHFYKDVGEWIPRDDGGGFVARHEVSRARDVPGAKLLPANRKTGKPDQNAWADSTGDHDLVDTRNHAVLVYMNGRVLPYLIALSSTGHSVSRSWMSRINDKIIMEGSQQGKPYPSFAHLYRLTTEQRKNAQGQVWFSLKAEDERWAVPEEYKAGRKLHAQFVSGEKRAEAPLHDGGAPDGAAQHSAADEAI